MPSKRSRQHNRRRAARQRHRVAERVARTLIGDAAGDLAWSAPVYNIVKSKMRSAYMTLGAALAVAQYTSPRRLTTLDASGVSVEDFDVDAAG